MEYLFIYLMQAADIINKTNIFIIIISVFVCAWSIVNYLECKHYNDNAYVYYKPLIKCSTICLILSISMLFIPTKQTLLLIGGTYLGKKAVNTVITDEKIKKVDEIINLQLDKYLNELKKQN